MAAFHPLLPIADRIRMDRSRPFPVIRPYEIETNPATLGFPECTLSRRLPRTNDGSA